MSVEDVRAADVRAHTFDGIEEFDNRLPNWWLWTFYLACIFSVGYWVHYHTLGTGDSPTDEYNIAQAEAAALSLKRARENPVTNESLIELSKNPEIIKEGRKIFENPQLCAQCHNASGNGNIGPNLTDEHWVYGNSPMDIYETILKGRATDPEKGYVGGMQAWEAKGPEFVQTVTAYVLSIMHTNVSGKAPEANAKKLPKSF
ncbi:MAG: c-type cytochrome [bacterium]|nr:c-type cytochrome [bacterium]